MFSVRDPVLLFCLTAVNSLDDDGYGEPPDLGGEFKIVRISQCDIFDLIMFLLPQLNQPPTRASIFTAEFHGNESCPGCMWLVASYVACGKHAHVILAAPTTRALVIFSGTKLESPVSEDHHRGQLFRFGLIGDVQALKHTITIR